VTLNLDTMADEIVAELALAPGLRQRLLARKLAEWCDLFRGLGDRSLKEAVIWQRMKALAEEWLKRNQ
jgi:hypothetical protein